MHSPSTLSWKDRIFARAAASIRWWFGILQDEDDRWRAEAGIAPVADPGPEAVAPTACSKADEPVPLAMLVAQRQAEVSGGDDANRN